jgi:hypothetical protein
MRMVTFSRFRLTSFAVSSRRHLTSSVESVLCYFRGGCRSFSTRLTVRLLFTKVKIE